MLKLTRQTATSWTGSGWWPSLDRATADLDAPFGVISIPALAHNAFDLLDRANGRPIRVASKSVRVRGVLDAVLALPGYSGVLAYTLPEALWLADTIEDVVVGYPTVDRAAIRKLALDESLARRVTLMVDSVAQLDLIDALIAPSKRSPIRLCLELDSSWETVALGHIGVYRSPVHTAAEARELASQIVGRAGFTLVGMMGYEAQIAGVGDKHGPQPAAFLRWMQRSSASELAERRGRAVAAVREVASLEFVNGGGTGSLESTASDPSVTEIAAGSGLFGPHLFDGYSHFSPAPAASFALSVVRKPGEKLATILGGGWIASGPPNESRLPQIVWPEGLRMVGREMAGEVQTPVTGASDVRIGDRVWFRHTKAGELAEHLNSFALVNGADIVGELPTYRGEGKAFL